MLVRDSARTLYHTQNVMAIAEYHAGRRVLRTRNGRALSRPAVIVMLQAPGGLARIDRPHGARELASGESPASARPAREGRTAALGGEGRDDTPPLLLTASGTLVRLVSIRDGLEFLEHRAALLADVLVDRHGLSRFVISAGGRPPQPTPSRATDTQLALLLVEMRGLAPGCTDFAAIASSRRRRGRPGLRSVKVVSGYFRRYSARLGSVASAPSQ